MYFMALARALQDRPSLPPDVLPVSSDVLSCTGWQGLSPDVLHGLDTGTSKQGLCLDVLPDID